VVIPPADDSLPSQGTRAAQAGDRMKPAQCASGPEPDAGQGTLLTGRYRLVERLGEQDGSAEWRATDEMLARTVTVRVFTLESRHVARVMAAARAARRVSDPRLARIFDADDGAEPRSSSPDGHPAGASVASGQSMLDPRAASQLMARLRDQSVKHDPLAGLSAQERRILELIGEGLTNRQIGERMFLAEKTVKNYVSALFAKLGMHHRTQAAAYAVRAFGDHHHTGDGGPGVAREYDPGW
jgi:DNA-binding CsgD family transcriptional regulator